jgi:hypothetical protein
MNEAEVKKLIETDPDFVCARRFGNSLSRLEERYPDGCPDHVIASALGISEDEVQEKMDTIIEKLRTAMGVKP